MEKELEAIERGRQEVKKLAELNAKTAAVSVCLQDSGSDSVHCQQIVCSSSAREVLPVRSVQPLTEPQEFAFATDARLGVKATKKEPTPPRKKQRRENSTERAAPTVPQPFSFETDKRVRSEGCLARSVVSAQAVQTCRFGVEAEGGRD